MSLPETSLLNYRPDLAAQWHPTKNGTLLPSEVTYGSTRKVWWLDHGHEWQATPNNRSNGWKCGVCRGFQVMVGVNDLATTNPELARQWHPTNNHPLLPTEVTCRSGRKVWWLHHGHQWEATIKSRDNGQGCAVCVGRQIMVGVNDLSSVNTGLAAQWHPTKNGSLTPHDVTAQCSRQAWWVDTHGHEWRSTINNRATGLGCPFCSNRQLLDGFNDLATTHPDVASRWHPTKNGDLTPRDVGAGSSRKVWWQDHGHDWQAPPKHGRDGQANHGCGVCRGLQVMVGVNDLATTRPDLARQWHPHKQSLTPYDVTTHSMKRAWWLDSHGHEWSSTIASRSNGAGCPECALLAPRMTSAVEQAVRAELRRRFSGTRPHGTRLPRTDGRNHNRAWNCDIVIDLPNQKPVIVEYDGDYRHHGNEQGDRAKATDLRHQGHLVVRIRTGKLSLLHPHDVHIPAKDAHAKKANLIADAVQDRLSSLGIEADA